MDAITDLLTTELVFGNTVGNFVAFFVALFTTFAAGRIVQVLFNGRLQKLAAASETEFDDALLEAVERPIYLMTIAGGLRLSVETLVLPEVAGDAARHVLVVVLIVFLSWCLTRAMDAFRKVFVDPWVEESETKLDDQLVPILDKTIKGAIWSMAILIAFSNLGYDIVSLLTGLGIGGLAVAMAAQATLSNVVGSITIFADQPFQVDDLISIGEHTGVVIEVGLRSCRIKTLEGYVVHIPNASVVDQPVINRTVDDRWRYDATIGLVYDTSAAQLREAMQCLREILTENPSIEDDYAVRFTQFGDSALGITFAYWINDPSAGRYLDTMNDVHLTIKERFDERGFSMAFPSMSLYVESTPQAMQRSA